MDANEMQKIIDGVAANLAALQARTATPPILPLSSMPPAGIPGMVPASAGPIGAAVACSIGLPDGSEASVYITLDPSALADLPRVIAGLQAQGWPIRTFQPRQNGWGRPAWNQGYGRGWRR